MVSVADRLYPSRVADGGKSTGGTRGKQSSADDAAAAKAAAEEQERAAAEQAAAEAEAAEKEARYDAEYYTDRSEKMFGESRYIVQAALSVDDRQSWTEQQARELVAAAASHEDTTEREDAES